MFPAPQPDWIYAISQTQAVLSASVPLAMVLIQPQKAFLRSVRVNFDLQVQAQQNVNKYVPVLRSFYLASFYSTTKAYCNISPYFSVCPLNITLYILQPRIFVRSRL